ncbi:uncharacterized protein F5891DRAFT_1198465 [Suillus fuscotomentosus]|uniref:Uncharacterized protein n=1 Tax=Suillus fuscotomentosus TaxID=1912939 RepID=A0AAD4DRV4_9AGAM|nr:uncharacterized protein F5891DRAFT_1198465 [Suillus fuscotomentosus]KAG1889694.1 hypothetical protein F5891DRAFT_1198465 [Suillus fuscotomentosus]
MANEMGSRYQCDNSFSLSVDSTLSGHNSDMICLPSVDILRHDNLSSIIICTEPSLEPRKSYNITDHLDDTLVEYTPDQSIPENHSAVDQWSSPNPGYMGSSPASFDYIEEQFGRGHQYELPPAELTPSRLRTKLKATMQDTGIVKDASARCQAYQNPSAEP